MGFYVDYPEITTKRRGSRHNISRDQYLLDPSQYAPDCSHRAKLTPEQVRELRRVNDERMELLSRLKELPSIRELAARYGVSNSAAEKAAIGLTHKRIR